MLDLEKSWGGINFSAVSSPRDNFTQNHPSLLRFGIQVHSAKMSHEFEPRWPWPNFESSNLKFSLISRSNYFIYFSRRFMQFGVIKIFSFYYETAGLRKTLAGGRAVSFRWFRRRAITYRTIIRAYRHLVYRCTVLRCRTSSNNGDLDLILKVQIWNFR